MLLFVLEKIAFCIRIGLEKYWFEIVLSLRTGIVLAKSWFSIVLYCFCIGIVLEKYWFNTVLYCFWYWNNIL